MSARGRGSILNGRSAKEIHMAGSEERSCYNCGDTEGEAHLERCLVCGKWFCPEHCFKQTGRRFCAAGCARDFFWGMTDEDDEDDDTTQRDAPEY